VTGIKRVFPNDAPAGGGGPVASTGGGSIRLGGMRLGKREAAVGGAVAVAGLALFARARAGGDASTDEDVLGAGATRDGDTAAQYEIDTRSTDFYNELQPELEAIGDNLSGLPQAVVDALPDAQNPYTAAPSPVPSAPKAKPKAKKPGSGAKAGGGKGGGGKGGGKNSGTKKPKPTPWVNVLKNPKPKPAPKPAPAPKPKKKK
jgi:hypothetical protein